MERIGGGRSAGRVRLGVVAVAALVVVLGLAAIRAQDEGTTGDPDLVLVAEAAPADLLSGVTLGDVRLEPGPDRSTLVRVGADGRRDEVLRLEEGVALVAVDARDEVGVLVLVQEQMGWSARWSVDGTDWRSARIDGADPSGRLAAVVTATDMMVVAHGDPATGRAPDGPWLWRVQPTGVEAVPMVGADAPDPVTVRPLSRMHGVVAVEASGTLWTTSDGVLWTASALGPYAVPFQVHVAPQGAFALASLASSPDGGGGVLLRAAEARGPWQPVDLGTPAQGSLLTGIHAANDVAVVALSSETPMGAEGTGVSEWVVHYSGDGRTWRTLRADVVPELATTPSTDEAGVSNGSSARITIAALDRTRFLLTLSYEGGPPTSYVLRPGS